MTPKDKLRSQVKIVCQLTGKTQEQIAEELDYGKNYISEILSPSGAVSRKFLNAFEAKYLKYIEPKRYIESEEYENQLLKEAEEAGLTKRTIEMDKLLQIVQTQSDSIHKLSRTMDNQAEVLKSQQTTIKEQVDLLKELRVKKPKKGDLFNLNT